MQFFRTIVLFFFLVIVFSVQISAQTDSSEQSYSKYEVQAAMEGFFAKTTKGIASMVERLFSRYGKPNAYIKGEEGGGAIFMGLRYGKGTLHKKSGLTRQVYWQGPSIGWDIGGNAVKVFTLVYNLQDVERLYQRFPGIDGSIYVVGGLSMNVQRSQDITMVPIRTGVGLRLGGNVGYLQYTKEMSLNPF